MKLMNYVGETYDMFVDHIKLMDRNAIIPIILYPSILATFYFINPPAFVYFFMILLLAFMMLAQHLGGYIQGENETHERYQPLVVDLISLTGRLAGALQNNEDLPDEEDDDELFEEVF